MECWRTIAGFPQYEVSDCGRVRSLKKGVKILKPQQHSGGYQKVTFWRNGEEHQIFVHKLVLIAFVGPRPASLQACHGDGDKTNNQLFNLRWDTPAANQMDRVAHGTRYGRPGRLGPRKDMREIVAYIRRESRPNISALARELNLPRTTVADIVNRRTHA